MKKIALFLALALCAVILSGCAEINSLVSGVTGGSFNGGSAVIADKIENLDISWTAGSVKIAYHAENTVTLDETASREIREDDRLQWKVEGATLKVQYNKPSIRLNEPRDNREAVTGHREQVDWAAGRSNAERRMNGLRNR